MSTEATLSGEAARIISANGQITLDDDILAHLGAGPGSKLIARKLPNGAVELRLAGRRGKIANLVGFLTREGQRTVSIEEMNEAIAAGWAGEV